MVGRVVTILADGSVDVMPDLEELKDSIPLPPNQLSKHFKVGRQGALLGPQIPVFGELTS